MLLVNLSTQKASQGIHNGLHVCEKPSSGHLEVAPLFYDIYILNSASRKFGLHITHPTTH